MGEGDGKSKWVVLIILVLFVVAGVWYWHWETSRDIVSSDLPGDEGVSSKDQTCRIVASATTTLYARPSISADVFGELGSGEEVLVSARTSRGWFGFDPGVAQAPNVGPFRLRYIAPDAPIEHKGCEAVSVIAELSPKTCFVMAQTDIAIYEGPSATSRVLAVLHLGDYVQAVGVKNHGAKDITKYWAKVTTELGSMPSGIMGWIRGSDINFNGHCDLTETQ